MKGMHICSFFLLFLPSYLIAMEQAGSSIASNSFVFSFENMQDKHKEHMFLASEILNTLLSRIVAAENVDNEIKQSLPFVAKKIETLEQADQDTYSKVLCAIRVERKVKPNGQPLLMKPFIRELGLVMYAQILYNRLEETQKAAHMLLMQFNQLKKSEYERQASSSDHIRDDKKKKKDKKQAKFLNKSNKKKHKLF